MSSPKKKKKDPALITGECCDAMKRVLSQEKKENRTGLFIPLVVWGTESKTLKQKPADLCYRPTGRNAQTFFLNYCPWCGKRISSQ